MTPGESVEGLGGKSRATKMKPKFTCRALNRTDVTNVTLTDSAWVLRGSAR